MITDTVCGHWPSMQLHNHALQSFRMRLSMHAPRNIASNSLSIFQYHNSYIPKMDVGYLIYAQLRPDASANSVHRPQRLIQSQFDASTKVRLCRDRSFFRVAIQEVKGCPTGLLQSKIWTAPHQINQLWYTYCQLLKLNNSRIRNVSASQTNGDCRLLLTVYLQPRLCWRPIIEIVSQRETKCLSLLFRQQKSSHDSVASTAKCHCGLRLCSHVQPFPRRHVLSGFCVQSSSVWHWAPNHTITQATLCLTACNTTDL